MTNQWKKEPTVSEELIQAQNKMLEYLKDYLNSGKYCFCFEMELGYNAEPENTVTVLEVVESGTEIVKQYYYDLGNVNVIACQIKLLLGDIK